MIAGSNPDSSIDVISCLTVSVDNGHVFQMKFCFPPLDYNLLWCKYYQMLHMHHHFVRCWKIIYTFSDFSFKVIEIKQLSRYKFEFWLLSYYSLSIIISSKIYNRHKKHTYIQLVKYRFFSHILQSGGACEAFNNTFITINCNQKGENRISFGIHVYRDSKTRNNINWRVGIRTCNH